MYKIFQKLKQTKCYINTYSPETEPAPSTSPALHNKKSHKEKWQKRDEEDRKKTGTQRIKYYKKEM